MRSIKASLTLAAGVGSLLLALLGQGCGSDNGGGADAGPQLTTGIYTASDARNVVDNCHTNPTGLAGTQYLVVVDAGTGFVQFYGTTTADPVGTPPQPAQGQGTLSEGQAVLNRENDTTIAGTSCVFHLKVVNTIMVTRNNAFTSAYERTETNHIGNCPTDHPDNCTTTFNWDLAQ
jgi:hypothetical protein